MKSKIITVEETFDIQGRGLILVGKFDFNSSIIVRAGDKIKIVRPNKTILQSNIVGIEFLCGVNKPLEHLSFSIGKVEKEQVPIGSEVFLEV